ncbi:MAG: hypothetical protein K5989_00900 [Lachnospiraceae bacterium]|nr:hypothetical protein [Lachnospiraceae bacterium]
MYRCVNCGAGMRFDIASQQLHCDYCDASMAVADHPDERVASEEDMFDVTVFCCPQCGGELMSTENAATDFCSYCGASVILEGRIGKEKSPDLVIPFLKTKEECQEIYKKKIHSAIFLPKEFKDPDHIDKIRGIYLPYWVYDVKQQGDVSLTGTRETSKYTEYLKMDCHIDNDYDGVTRDASSAFDDRISDFIAPFNTKSMRPFTPAYLAGFFADISDVSGDVYNESVKNETNKRTEKQIDSQYPGASINYPPDESAAFGTEITSMKSAMFPVWFLSWRRDDRVAYAVINGETGKICTDLPVDKKKYYLGSVLLAIPIFLLLSFLPTIRATTLVTVSSILSVGTMLIYAVNSRTVYRREEHLDDLGYQAKLAEEREGEAGSAPVPVEHAEAKKKVKSDAVKEIVPSVIVTIIALLVRFLIKPVSDIPYYACAIAVLLCSCYVFTVLIKKYNVFATRPLPEFHNRKGGENYE